MNGGLVVSGGGYGRMSLGMVVRGGNSGVAKV